MHNLKRGPMNSEAFVWESISEDGSSEDGNSSGPSQTLFIRGYTIKRNAKHPQETQPSHLYQRSSKSQSKWLKGFKIRAAAEPRGFSRLPPPSPPTMALKVLGESGLPDLEIDELYARQPPRHPIEEFIDLLFEMEPESSFGILHDDDALKVIHRLNRLASALPMELVRRQDAFQLELIHPRPDKCLETPQTRPLFTLSLSGKHKVVSFNVSPGPSLPMLDLGPKILAYLHSDKQSLCVLAQTCHLIKSLTAPLLYRVVTIRSRRALKDFIFAISVSQCNSRQHVHDVRIQNVVPTSLDPLHCCPHLGKLIINGKRTKSSQKLSLPSTVTMLSSDPAHFRIGHSPFRNLTHLHFVRTLTKSHVWFWLRGTNLSALRYLIMQHTNRVGQLQNLIHEIIPKLGYLPSNPDLHILLWFPQAVSHSFSSMITQETLDFVDGLVDSRLIVVAHQAGRWPERIRNRCMDLHNFREFDGTEESGVIWKQVERAVEERVLMVPSKPMTTESPDQMMNDDHLSDYFGQDSESEGTDQTDFLPDSDDERRQRIRDLSNTLPQTIVKTRLHRKFDHTDQCSTVGCSNEWNSSSGVYHQTGNVGYMGNS
ncbi:hypothetical protein DL96DRAFT_1616663 [Flagelloscypha sp. PMI_526]|nr:hypothetical protein DL96DRAFT_1616663 [Flagelloscypha sp. PMI_526]